MQLSTPRRTGPTRGATQGSPGARRPRVAGLRKRASQDSQAEPTVDSTTQQEQDEAPVTSEEVPDAASAETSSEPEVAAEAEPEATQRVEEPEAEEGDAGEEEPASAEPVPSAESAPSSETDATEQLTRPQPRGKLSTAQPVPQAEEETPDLPAPASADQQGSAAGRGPLIAAMLVVAVICAGLAVWFRYEERQLTADGPAANQALVDAAATSQINGQVSDAVEKVFSYNFADTGKTERAAKDLLTGPAVGQYDQLFATVKQQAPQQRLVLTTTVKASGITRLEGDRAQVLLFVDQNAVRTDSGQNNVGPAQVSVTVEKQGDQWKINGIVLR